MYFILTRFNERYPEIKDNLCLDESWLKVKVNTFKQITIPSIEQQTDQDFYWIVKFHKDTPLWVREELDHPKIISDFNFCLKIENTIEKHRMFDSIYLDKHPCNRVICKHYFKNKIKEILGSKNIKYITTTNLDSDDGLSINYVEVAKSEIRPNAFFDFGMGIARVKNKNKINYIKYGTNDNVSPFYSYCEPISNKRIKTIFYIPHHHVGSKCIRINETGWMQTMDETNLINNTEKIKNSKSLDPDDLRNFPYVCF